MVDPDLSKTLSKQASYDDYASESFPVKEHDGYQEKVFSGDDGPMEMDATGLKFRELDLKPGLMILKLKMGQLMLII